jgi:hypothetical protein
VVTFGLNGTGIDKCIQFLGTKAHPASQLDKRDAPLTYLSSLGVDGDVQKISGLRDAEKLLVIQVHGITSFLIRFKIFKTLKSPDLSDLHQSAFKAKARFTQDHFWSGVLVGN